jgi:hypothetical protein
LRVARDRGQESVEVAAAWRSERGGGEEQQEEGEEEVAGDCPIRVSYPAKTQPVTSLRQLSGEDRSR